MNVELKMKDKNMTNLEKNRLDDFKKVLTYHLVSKIKYYFKSNYKLYYYAPELWWQWRNKRIDYATKIYDLITKFNQTALSTKQVRCIFGKTPDNKYFKYSELISSDTNIKTFNKGTLCVKDRRYGIKKRYQLPFEFIKNIFENTDLLNKVIDAKSDYYSERQRRLIFTQINKQQHYHYKTKKELIQDLTDEEMVNALINEL